MYVVDENIEVQSEPSGSRIEEIEENSHCDAESEIYIRDLQGKRKIIAEHQLKIFGNLFFRKSRCTRV